MIVWLWLKKNWKWIVLPVGVLVWLLGRSSKKPVVQAVSPELLGHSSVKAELEQEGIRRLKEAAAQHEAQRAALDAKNQQVLREINERAELKAAELVENPDNVNDFLKKVGRDVRGQSKT